MKPLIDAIGSSMMLIAAAAPLSCIPATHAKVNLQPLIAAAGAYSLMAAEAGPTPAPTPDGDKCQNCGGTGRLSDSRVSVECPVCDGTGKSKKDPPVTTAKPATKVTTPPCKNGNCPLPTRVIVR